MQHLCTCLWILSAHQEASPCTFPSDIWRSSGLSTRTLPAHKCFVSIPIDMCLWAFNTWKLSQLGCCVTDRNFKRSFREVTKLGFSEGIPGMSQYRQLCYPESTKLYLFIFVRPHGRPFYFQVHLDQRSNSSSFSKVVCNCFLGNDNLSRMEESLLIPQKYTYLDHQKRCRGFIMVLRNLEKVV